MRHVEHAMGTAFSFEVPERRLSRRKARAAVRGACDALHRADEVFSTARRDSPISRVRRGEIRIGDAPPEVANVLSLCAEARTLSGGAFDPWAMPGGVDPAGLVKGWAAQRAVEALESAGVEAAVLEAAGDVVGFGRLWRIGLLDPLNPRRVLCVLETEGAVATSAVSDRGDHVFDPRSGRPARLLLSATVTGPDLGLADGLATGLFAAGEDGIEQVAALDGYGAIVVRPDGTVATGGELSPTLSFISGSPQHAPTLAGNAGLHRPRRMIQ